MKRDDILMAIVTIFCMGVAAIFILMVLQVAVIYSAERPNDELVGKAGVEELINPDAIPIYPNADPHWETKMPDGAYWCRWRNPFDKAWSAWHPIVIQTVESYDGKPFKNTYTCEPGVSLESPVRFSVWTNSTGDCEVIDSWLGRRYGRGSDATIRAYVDKYNRLEKGTVSYQFVPIAKPIEQ